MKSRLIYNQYALAVLTKAMTSCLVASDVVKNTYLCYLALRGTGQEHWEACRHPQQTHTTGLQSVFGPD